MSNQNPPILVAASGRSGTTMIAWLLHLHGAWIGKAGVTKAPQTNPQVGTENTAIKNYLKGAAAGADVKTFRRDILKMVKTEGPWLIKTAGTLRHWQKFEKAFPDCKWVLPIRPTKDIVESMKRHPGMKGDDISFRRRAEFWKKHQNKVMDNCKNVFAVSPGALVAGNVELARQMMEFCGLQLEREVYLGWIDPERWHG